MSVKCKVSIAYYPLLVNQYVQDSTIDKVNFQKFIRDYFVEEDFDNIMSMMEKGGSLDTTAPVPSLEVKAVSSRLGFRESENAKSAEEFYPGQAARYNTMRSTFVKKIISLSVYDLEEGFRQPNNYAGDSTNLNVAIREYKSTLINILSDYIKGERFDLDSSYAKQNLDKLLADVRTVLSSIEDKNDDYYKVFDAYVILKSFDDLLYKECPFISINKIYSNPFAKMRYEYVGPNTKLYNGWSSSESASIEENTGSLVKILLNYLPECDINGNIIPNTSIGFTAFNSIMTRIKNWAVANQKWDGTVNVDVNTIITEYINSLGVMDQAHKSYLLNKIRGIQKFIYGANMSKDIQQLFTHLVNKTVMTSYVSYQGSATSEVIDDARVNSVNMRSRNLTERPILMQRKSLEECVSAASVYFTKYPDQWRLLQKKYNIQRPPVGISKGYMVNGSLLSVDSKNVYTQLSEADVVSMITDMLSLVIPDDFNYIAQSQGLKGTVQSLYPVLIYQVIDNVLSGKVDTPVFGPTTEIAKVLSVINGLDVVSVIKNSEGNALPVYQLNSLAYRFYDIYSHLKDKQGWSTSVYTDNVVFNNFDKIKEPKIRSEVNINGHSKSISSLSADDVLYLAVGYDFYKNLMESQSEGDNQRIATIGLQPHVFSDKVTHFIIPFDINSKWTGLDNSISFYLKEYLASGDDKSILEPLKTVWRTSNKKQLDTQVKKIIDDYNFVFDKQLETLEGLNDFVKTKSREEIQNAFKDKNVTFVDEFHLSKGSLNETLMYLYKVFSSKEAFDDFINKQWEQFRSNADKVVDLIRQDKNLGAHTSNKINKILYAYFITDSFLSSEYNKMMVGDVWYHPNKEKGSYTVDNALASRWVSQVKRMVIYGATYHPLAQGLTLGVDSEVKAAIIEDLTAFNYNYTGDSAKVDASDGSGYSSPIFSRMVNVSLMDAAVGPNKKTIFHDIDIYGRPTLFKWAEYEITNAIRRNKGTIDTQKVFEKMHNFPIKESMQSFKYVSYPENLYYYDSNSKCHYKIYAINIENSVCDVTLQEVTEIGSIVNNDFIVKSYDINTINDLDKALGGAWCKTFNKDTGVLEYSELNMDILHDIVCQAGVKQSMIGWLVNKSACKVGVANLNSKSAWTDNSPLNYIQVSTRFGGIQMDADHDLKDADVTEASQMIGGLEQMGHTHNLATEVYKKLGEFCAESVAELREMLENGDRDALYNIFGKAVIKAFQTGNKDTLGLAQSFIKLAQADLNEQKLEYRIPLSSPSINGIFNSTVVSDIIKGAIRRHYAGVASVLHPSYGMIGLYNINGSVFKYEDIIEKLWKILPKWVQKYTPEEFMAIESLKKEYIDDNGNPVKNPFIEDVTASNPIDFEDTVIINIGEEVHVDKIDSIEKYYYYKGVSNIKKWTIQPKNLKGFDVKFTINDSVYSLYDTKYSKLLYFNSKLASQSLSSIKSELESMLQGYGQSSVVSEIYKLFEEAFIPVLKARGITDNIEDATITTQEFNSLIKPWKDGQMAFLTALDEKTEVTWDGASVIPSDYKIIPAQIVMGKLYAQQFGLHAGDSIQEIRSQGSDFFKKRIKAMYQHDNPDALTYDAVLYDGSGKKLFVKYQTKDPSIDLYTTDSYLNVEGDIYQNGKKLFSGNGKLFGTYISSEGLEYDYVIVDNNDRIREMLNSGVFNYTEYNYNESNRVKLVQLEFGDDLGATTIPVKVGKQITYIPIASFETTEEMLKALNSYRNFKFDNYISRIAQNKYTAFEQSLQFVGTRIPCQGMTSFAPMEVVAFVDSEINEVYIPTQITWIQGSDYDIDKQYITGYSVENNGAIVINDGGKQFLKENALKNQIVSGILDIIHNPKNILSLTVPVSTDRLQDMAKNSDLGKSAKTMNGWDPSSKYRMQIENMVGKAVIGNVATAIKSFFALSNAYNTAFDNIYMLLELGHYTVAMEELLKYVGKKDGKWITLANVNMHKFKTLNLSSLPKDIQTIINDLLEYQDALEDVSLSLGMILNAATDNAKELILKKINADANWVDIYCVGLLFGESVEEIGEFMMDPFIVQTCNNFTSSTFSSYQRFNKLNYIERLIDAKNKELKNSSTFKEDAISAEIDKLITLFNRVKAAEELRIMGKVLKINQGIPTNTADIYSYMKSIETYIQQELPYFDLLKFVTDEEYLTQAVESMEEHKINFNILRVVSSVPHFKEMFKVLGITRGILDSLSVRNKVESIVLEKLSTESSDLPGISKKLDNTSIYKVKDQIATTLVNKWIISQGIEFVVPKGILGKVADEHITISNNDDIELFIQWMNTYVIPQLKSLDFTKSNEFIKALIFGLKGDKPFYKLPINMTQIDNTAKTLATYELYLRAFNNLRYSTVGQTKLPIVDLFYLYNLVLHQDKFGPSSFTRIFEDLITSEDGENLLVFKFNEWIDQQYPLEIAEEVIASMDTVSYTDTLENTDISIKETKEPEPREEAMTKMAASGPQVVYTTAPQVGDELLAKIKAINNSYIYIVTDSDLIDQPANIRNAKGFVKDGNVYINIDRADEGTVIHELGHLYLAEAKTTDPEVYYNLLKDVRHTALWLELRNHRDYTNKKGSDFDEEVLAHMFSDYFMLNNNNSVFRADYEYAAIMNRALALISADFKKLLDEKVLPTLSDELISNYRIRQKVATIKNKWMTEDVIKENC